MKILPPILPSRDRVIQVTVGRPDVVRFQQVDDILQVVGLYEGLQVGGVSLIRPRPLRQRQHRGDQRERREQGQQGDDETDGGGHDG